MQYTAPSLYYRVNLWRSLSSSSFWSVATLVMERLVWKLFQKPLPQRKHICEDHNYSKNWILIVKSWPYWSQSIFSIDFIVPWSRLGTQGTEVSSTNNISFLTYLLHGQKVTVLKEFCKNKLSSNHSCSYIEHLPASTELINQEGSLGRKGLCDNRRNIF